MWSSSFQAEDGAPDVDAQQAITELGAASLAILRARLKLATVLRGEGARWRRQEHSLRCGGRGRQ